MKTKTLGLIALLVAGILTLTGCGKSETPADENAEIANPASVYCEDQWGILTLEDGAWLCMFDDGSYCEERAYYRGECEKWEIFYNTVSDEEVSETSEVYSEDDLTAAETTIMNKINEWDVKVEWVELAYAGDDISTSNLEYCQSLNPEVTECAVFTSSFHIPEQDVQMAGAFEPNTDITEYSWYLGRANAGEWEVLTNGFG